MKKTWLLLLTVGLLSAGCEPFNLDKKTFPVCVKPSAAIGTIVTKLQVEFILNNLVTGVDDELKAGWDMGDGNNRTGTRFTYIYARPGTYTVKLILNNRCDYVFTTTQTVTVAN